MIVKYRDPYQWDKPIVVNLPDDTPQDMVDEVLAFLDEDYRRIHAAEERERAHRDFSFDALAYENPSIAYHDTPERVVIRREWEREWDERLATLTETQRRRLDMVTDGMSLREIARVEGVDVSSVEESIWAARKKMKKLL